MFICFMAQMYKRFLIKDKKVLLYYIIFFSIFADPFKTTNLFKKETEYALRGLIYIQAQNSAGRRPGIAEIAEEIDAPYFYTAKILQRLAKQGFVESTKGKGGGFSFNSEQPDLSLKTIITAIEGDHLFIGCGIGLKECSCENPCPIHDQFTPIRDSIERLVESETFQSLAEKVSAGDDSVLGRRE
jgi:Rrf2 family protein